MNQNEDSSRLYSNLSSDTLDTAKGFLFGVYIPFLPDFLLDHTLLGKEPSDRIQEYSRRWTQFVSGLWRGNGDVTYSLRFDLHETHKRIYVHLLGRLHTTDNNPQSINQANILLSDLERMLESFGFESKPLNQKALHHCGRIYNITENFRECDLY